MSLKRIHGKLRRCGNTIEDCICAATGAATYMLLSRVPIDSISPEVEGTISEPIDVFEIEWSKDSVSCAAAINGDNKIDVLNDIYIVARAKKAGRGIRIRWPEILKKAMNYTPPVSMSSGKQKISLNALIIKATRSLCKEHNYFGGISITLTIIELKASVSRDNDELFSKDADATLSQSNLIDYI